MNKKGQALVEFVIILPIFLVLVLGVIDIGKILYNKTMLEGLITEAVSMYFDGSSEIEIRQALDLEETVLMIDEEGSTVEFHLVQEIDLITPGFNLIFGNPYPLDVSRSIHYE